MVAVWAPYERFFLNPRKVGSVVSAYERLLSAFGSPMSDVPIEISKNIERKALIPLTNLLYKMFQNFKMLKILVFMPSAVANFLWKLCDCLTIITLTKCCPTLGSSVIARRSHCYQTVFWRCGSTMIAGDHRAVTSLSNWFSILLAVWSPGDHDANKLFCLEW